MAAPKTAKLATLQQDITETIGALQVLQAQVKALDEKVSAILRQDINAMNGFVLNGQANETRPF